MKKGELKLTLGNTQYIIKVNKRDTAEIIQGKVDAIIKEHGIPVDCTIEVSLDIEGGESV